MHLCVEIHRLKAAFVIDVNTDMKVSRLSKEIEAAFHKIYKNPLPQPIIGISKQINGKFYDLDPDCAIHTIFKAFDVVSIALKQKKVIETTAKLKIPHSNSIRTPSSTTGNRWNLDALTASKTKQPKNVPLTQFMQQSQTQQRKRLMHSSPLIRPKQGLTTLLQLAGDGFVDLSAQTGQKRNKGVQDVKESSSSDEDSNDDNPPPPPSSSSLFKSPNIEFSPESGPKKQPLTAFSALQSLASDAASVTPRKKNRTE